MSKPPFVALRALAVVAVVAVSGVGLLTLVRPVVPEVYDERPLGFVDAFVALCAVLTGLCWAWLQLTAALVAAAAVARACHRDRLAGLTERMARAAAPGGLRRLLLAACGVALSTGVVTMPASARTPTSPYLPPALRVATRPPQVLEGLAVPDRALGDFGGRPTWVTVRPGDSLWAIARRQLPPDADDQAVCAAWHRLARVNRTVLGDDPDLIHPGTRLRVPARRREGL